MTDRDNELLVRRMRDLASDALTFIDGMGKEDFLADLRTQQAIILNLFVIGELAARALREMPELVEAHPAVAWVEMRGLRNRIAHNYYSLNLDTVWTTVTEELPDLVEQITQSLGR